MYRYWKWNKYLTLRSEPSARVHIPVKQLGLSTGKVIIVRRDNR